MTGALFELAWRTLRGRLVRRLRLLRQPRYLVGSLLGAAYFLFFALRQLLSWQDLRGHGDLPPRLAEFLPWGIGLGTAVVATLMWAFASSKPALRLTEAEIHFLLPAPLSRRQILAYALWKQQVGILFGALIVAFVRGAGPPGQRFTRFFAAWALFTLSDLHLKGVSLWKARLREIPRSSARLRVGAAVAVGLVFWSLLLGSLWRIVRGAMGEGSFDLDAGPALATAATAANAATSAIAGLPGRLLSPFVWLGRPLLGDFGGGWLVLYLLGLLFVHSEWVLRSRGRFEEAALERARRQLARGERRTRGGALPAASSRRREPFALPPSGRPELAIFWKNLLVRSRFPLRWRVALFAVFLATLLAALSVFGAPEAMIGSLFAIGTLLLLVIPPFCGLFLRNDLRTDLRELETLRPWPIAGWRLVAAELLAPATAALAYLANGYGLVLVAGISAPAALRFLPGGLGAGRVGSFALLGCGYGSLFLVGLSIALLSIALQNLAILMLPAWLGTASPGRRGAAVTGQRILVFLAHILGLLAGLAVPALLVGIVLLVQWRLGLAFSLSEGPLLALCLVVPVLAEVALLVYLGGARWDRLDLSQEILDREE